MPKRVEIGRNQKSEVDSIGRLAGGVSNGVVFDLSQPKVTRSRSPFPDWPRKAVQFRSADFFCAARAYFCSPDSPLSFGVHPVEFGPKLKDLIHLAAGRVAPKCQLFVLEVL
jgi:hypothetical protein